MHASNNTNSNEIILVAEKETSRCKNVVGSFEAFHANKAKITISVQQRTAACMSVMTLLHVIWNAFWWVGSYLITMFSEKR